VTREWCAAAEIVLLALTAFQKCDLASIDPMAAGEVEPDGGLYVGHGWGPPSWWARQRQGECRLFVIQHSMRDRQQAIGNGTAVAKTCLPSSWSPLTGVTTGGILHPLAVIARRPPCLRVATSLMVSRLASHSGLEHVRLSVIPKRGLDPFRISGRAGRPHHRLDSFSLSLYPMLHNERFWQFARRRLSLDKSELRLASENLPPLSPRPSLLAWPTTTR
jgi:hypothetical protein